MSQDTGDDLAERIAGEIVLSEEPGATIRKWRSDFEIAQARLAEELELSPSVISDYESGRRENPGIGVVDRFVGGLLRIDERRGGEHRRRYDRVRSAGFESEIVSDIREYPVSVPIKRLHEAIDATEIVAGERGTVTGHTVINSIAAIRRLSSDEFYRLYGKSTNRALVFRGVTRGESPLVALRVMPASPSAVVLQGLSADDLWEHAPALARAEGFSLAVSPGDPESALAALRELP